MATGGAKQPPFHTARAQRTVRPPCPSQTHMCHRSPQTLVGSNARSACAHDCRGTYCLGPSAFAEGDWHIGECSRGPPLVLSTVVCVGGGGVAPTPVCVRKGGGGLRISQSQQQQPMISGFEVRQGTVPRAHQMGNTRPSASSASEGSSLGQGVSGVDANWMMEFQGSHTEGQSCWGRTKAHDPRAKAHTHRNQVPALPATAQATAGGSPGQQNGGASEGRPGTPPPQAPGHALTTRRSGQALGHPELDGQ